MDSENYLRGDDLKHYEAEIETMNLILISIPNDIYNSVDACTTEKFMWQRVERLMRGTVQNKVGKETNFNNEFDQFVAEPGEALVSYVTQVRLAKRLTKDSYDDLFDYLQQFEKLVNASRAKKLEKSHDPLALVVHMGSSSRTTSPYYVAHPSSVVDYDDNYQKDVVQHNFEDPLTYAMILLSRAIIQRFSNPTNNCLRTSSNTRNQAIVQGTAANVQCYNCSEKGHYARNYPKPRVWDSKIQPTNFDSDEGPSYDSAFLSEYPKQPKIINNTIGDDQIDNNIIFDEPNGDVNSGNVEYDNNIQESYALEQLARNAYKEAEKQQIIVKKFQQQNTMLTKQLESYKKKTQTNLKRRLSENEDKNHDTVIDLEARAKKNEDVVLKMGNSLQGMFMLGPKPMSFYDSKVKHGLGYTNPYTLKKAISYYPKLYDASFLDDSKIQMNVRDTKDILDDATNKNDLSETRKQNELLKDQLLEAKLKHEIEYCVLLSHECVDNSMQDEIEKIQRDSIEIQEGMQNRINILEMMTRTQTQGEINELIENVNQKTYAYVDVRAQNQDLLITISELKAKLENVEKVISSVRRPSHRDSSFKNSVLTNTKNSSEKVEVSDRTNKKSDVASKNVDSNKKIVTNDDIKNTLIAKNVLCVSCGKNVLIPCHDNYLAYYKLNVHSKVRKALFTTPRTVKSQFEDTTPVVSKTRFSVKTVQSKSLDTTPVVSKTKIVAITPLSAKHKVSSAFKLLHSSC
ncbi:integrase, catalytic region, zinc finger, CCHC-type containing protein [Tanacetum coccineum]